MKMKHINKLTNLVLSLTLIAAMTLCLAGCDRKEPQAPASSDSPSVETSVAEESSSPASESADVALKTFQFTVVDKDGNATVFDIETDKEIVGEALLEQGLIAGEEGQYGLYVKTVNGITADYDVDGTYWAFYVNDTYATSGVDTTPIVEGETYAFKVE